MLDLPCELNPIPPCSDHEKLYDGPQPACVILLRHVHGGPRCWSQVYEATVSSWDKDFSDQSQPLKSLVLKLYVASELASTGDWDPDASSDHLGSDPERAQQEMARNENKAYRALVGCPVTPRYEVNTHFCWSPCLSLISILGLSLCYLTEKSAKVHCSNI
jgi:hypothetical protein